MTPQPRGCMTDTRLPVDRSPSRAPSRSRSAHPSFPASRPAGVFVTYNSERHLERLFPGVLRTAFDEVIAVDNGSSDRSVDVARDAGFRTRRLHGNPGYAAAVNVGVRESHAEHVVVMNPDVVIDAPRVVDRLLVHFEDPSVGVVAPALLLPTGARQDSARDVPAPWQLVARRMFGGQQGRVDAEKPCVVDWVVGACLCIRRSAFEALGGFDERYRFYFEDVDFCVRLWRAGWKVVYDPTVVVRHEHGAGSRKTFLGWPMRQHIRGAARFYRRHPAFATLTGPRSAPRRRPGEAGVHAVRSA